MESNREYLTPREAIELVVKETAYFTLGGIIGRGGLDLLNQSLSSQLQYAVVAAIAGVVGLTYGSLKAASNLPDDQ